MNCAVFFSSLISHLTSWFISRSPIMAKTIPTISNSHKLELPKYWSSSIQTLRKTKIEPPRRTNSPSIIRISRIAHSSGFMLKKAVRRKHSSKNAFVTYRSEAAFEIWRVRDRLLSRTCAFHFVEEAFLFMKTSGITKNPQEAKKATRIQSSKPRVTV